MTNRPTYEALARLSQSEIAEKAPRVLPPVADYQSPEADPVCAGCSSIHGSLGEERNCMRLTIASLRSRLSGGDAP